MSVFKMVEEMNREIVKVPVREIGPIQDSEEVGYLIGCLREEIDEFEEAIDQDFIGQVDALIDLIYFAAGGLTRMGIPNDISKKIFTAVHDANMTKKNGVKEQRTIPHTLDAVKPEGWIGPEERIIRILEAHKFATQEFGD
jgi:predicted HAD superfamily Cof-like phosphohydrolase